MPWSMNKKPSCSPLPQARALVILSPTGSESAFTRARHDSSLKLIGFHSLNVVALLLAVGLGNGRFECTSMSAVTAGPAA
jgi:hypothetical protein